MVLRGYIVAWGIFFISFACQEYPQWDVRPRPHRKLWLIWTAPGLLDSLLSGWENT